MAHIGTATSPPAPIRRAVPTPPVPKKAGRPLPLGRPAKRGERTAP